MASFYLIYRFLLIFISHIAFSNCWQFFTSLSDLTLSKTPRIGKELHSSYKFGECKEDHLKELNLYTHIHFDHMEVVGKIIIRGWVPLYRIPTCIILEAFSHEEDKFRATAYNFQICVPRITYCHSKRRFKYYYYEWYIPSDYVGGMNWEMKLYGPKNPTW